MTSTKGPYWMHTTESGEHHVCGRHGKIIERFPAACEAEASAMVARLQGPAREQTKTAPSKMDLAREVVRLLGDEGNEQRATEIAKRGTADAMKQTIARLHERNGWAEAYE